MEDIEAVVSENLKFENRDKAEILAFLEFLEDKELVAWMKTKIFVIKLSSSIVKFFNEAPMEEIKPVVAEKKSEY